MLNTHYSSQNSIDISRDLLANSLDATRGAAQFGIRSQVLVHNDILDDYAELDSGMGRNVVGAVLAVLGCHVANGGSFVDTEVLSVCLRRRQDGQPVEVVLRVSRVRRSARECLAVSLVGEQPSEL